MNDHSMTSKLCRTTVFAHARRAGAALVLLALTFAASVSATGAFQAQTLTLEPGWNAVWIDPSPVYATGEQSGQALAVEDVFPTTRITVVARPLLPAGSAEFVTDSNSVFNQNDWLVWYRNPQSMINTLVTISGNQAYYIKVEGGDTALSVTLSGNVRFFRPDWVPGSYNLLGFNLSTTISFADFFGRVGQPDGNHPINAILRLDPVTGQWSGVQPTDLMRPGEAYWMKAVRNSNFSGPVAIAFDGFGKLAFGKGPGNLSIGDPAIVMTSQEITFSNLDDKLHPLTINLVAPTPANELRIYEVVPGPTGLSHAFGPAGQVASWNLGELAAGTTRTVTLGAERNWTAGNTLRENLYRIEVGPQFFWLPTTAVNEEVEPGTSSSPNAAYAGLWVGEVLLDSVSSVDSNELTPSTSSAAMQVILHANDKGALSLLGHAMVMKTKTADPAVPSEEVLVLDEAKIPYFEGIEIHGGKRVGRRIETVSYDLPRNNDPAVQAALRDEVAAANPSIGGPGNVTAANIQAFLNAQTSRPPDLVEAYQVSWPLEGGLGPEAVVRTATTAPLTLDPFHRSNPFRHAFHPRHAAGYPVSRSMTIVFDSTAIPGLLRGTYQESISGLAAHPVSVRGRVTLRRISKVSQTQ
ncbi:MAG: hypothetical protein L0Z50_09995 [Verrucomicrobiales bacterium]|nr:hypothetical protein [Verrucomicrobiales bacterium]